MLPVSIEEQCNFHIVISSLRKHDLEEEDQEVSFILPQVEQVHHLSSISVEHREQVQILDFMLIDRLVAVYFFSASAICLVTSGGRSEVQASHARKLTGLCRVQTMQVQPETKRGDGSGSEDAMTGGETDCNIEEEDEPLEGIVFGFFEVCSATSRLTGRSDGRRIGGALALGGSTDSSTFFSFLGLISPPPLPVGSVGVGGM
jgi:hypothetical protein